MLSVCSQNLKVEDKYISLPGQGPILHCLKAVAFPSQSFPPPEAATMRRLFPVWIPAPQVFEQTDQLMRLHMQSTRAVGIIRSAVCDPWKSTGASCSLACKTVERIVN